MELPSRKNREVPEVVLTGRRGMIGGVTTTPVPMLLPSNQFDHFYRGGDRIRALRGGPGGPRRPEEWIASATTRAGELREGLSALPSGELLRDAVRADPDAWLGRAHVERYGSEGV